MDSLYANFEVILLFAHGRHAFFEELEQQLLQSIDRMQRGKRNAWCEQEESSLDFSTSWGELQLLWSKENSYRSFPITCHVWKVTVKIDAELSFWSAKHWAKWDISRLHARLHISPGVQQGCWQHSCSIWTSPISNFRHFRGNISISTHLHEGKTTKEGVDTICYLPDEEWLVGIGNVVMEGGNNNISPLSNVPIAPHTAIWAFAWYHLVLIRIMQKSNRSWSSLSVTTFRIDVESKQQQLEWNQWLQDRDTTYVVR